MAFGDKCISIILLLEYTEHTICVILEHTCVICASDVGKMPQLD